MTLNNSTPRHPARYTRFLDCGTPKPALSAPEGSALGVHKPFHAIPQLWKRFKDDFESLPFFNTQQSGYVFKDKIARPLGFKDSGKLKEQIASFIGCTKPFSCDRERLIVIGNSLRLSPNFPPLHTVHETFTSHGVLSTIIFDNNLHNFQLI